MSIALVISIAITTAAVPIDLDIARIAFAQAETLSAKDAGALWGRPLYGPMVLVDPATRFCVANVADEGDHLVEREGVYVGAMPPEVPLGNTAVTWAGQQWTMLLWPLPGRADDRGMLLMHECFHRIQTGIGIPLSAPANHHLDTAEGRQWLRLEWRALAAALDAEDPADAVHDALVFRAYRQGLFEDAAKEERELELNEGLAEYTGIRVAIDDEPQRRTIARAKLQNAEAMATYVRTFAYTSGPAYGLLLDKANPQWRRRVRTRADLALLLARAMKIPHLRGNLEAQAHTRGAAYALADVAAEEAARAIARRERQARLEERFVVGPVLRVKLTGKVQYSFNPHDMATLPGLGTVYGVIELSGPFGILAVTGGGLLIEGDDGRALVVPAPSSPRDRVGDGWSLRLTPGWGLEEGEREGDYVLRAPRKR